MLVDLKSRGINEQAWPESGPLDGAIVVITIWSGKSVCDELIVLRADQAMATGRHVPVLIDDIQPLIGFRQSQMIVSPEISSALAQAIEDYVLESSSVMQATNTPAEKSIVDSLILAIISMLTVYAVFITALDSRPLSGLLINVFIILSISTYLLLTSIVRQPRVFLTKARSGPGLLQLFALDAAGQIVFYILASTLIVVSIMTDPRLLGDAGDFGPTLLIAMAGAYTAGLLVRWCIIVLMTRIRFVMR